MRSRRDGSVARVHRHRLGIVVREEVVKPGLDDRLPRRAGGGRHPHALVPPPEVAQNALDDGAVVDERDDLHLPRAAWASAFASET